MSTVFFNNEYCTDERLVSINDRGFLLGDGLFETIRIFAGSAPFLNRHWERFISAARLLGIPVPIHYEALKLVIDELVVKNSLKEASVRVTLTRGQGARGIGISKELKPNLLATIAPLILGNEKPLSVLFSSIRKNEYSPLSRIKSLNYLDNILARKEAQEAGFDDAILLNTKGSVADATIANVFFIKNNILCTPSVEEGALPGITREIVLDIAQKQGIETKLGSFSAEELFSADEAFLTNTLSGIMPIQKINQAIITENAPGSITRKLSEVLGRQKLPFC